MARKSTASTSKAKSSDASKRKTSTPKKKTSKPNPPANRKRKIDWSTFDEEEHFTGFTVITVKTVFLKPPKDASDVGHKRQKTGAPATEASYTEAPTDADVVQLNPYLETEIGEVHCKIEPAAVWESTQRYRKFTINGEEFQIGQVVFVKKAEEEHDTPDSLPQWFALILEVRAGDASHVYLRVYWAYRPEDLPGGRKPHHGAGELIVSNHMEIIEALTIESRADVIYWDDDPEKSEWPRKDQLFWRQSLDITKPRGHQFSKLRTHCIDKTPCNPDDPLVYCPSCNHWLHARCLEQQAVQATHTNFNIPLPTAKPKSKGRLPKKKPNPDPSPPPASFTAKLLTTSESGKTRLTVKDKRQGQSDRQWDVDVQCLLCHATIEKAADNPLEELAPEPLAEPAGDQDGITVVAAKPRLAPSASTESESETTEDLWD